LIRTEGITNKAAEKCIIGLVLILRISPEPLPNVAGDELSHHVAYSLILFVVAFFSLSFP